MRNKKGFTLIEILTVIAIMGFLSSIVLVGMGGIRAKGRDAKRIAEIKEVQNSLELYFSSFGYYPTTTDWTQLATELAKVGIKKLPLDPLKGKSYKYAPANGAAPTGYILGAELEDPYNQQLTDESGDVDGTPAGYNMMNFNCGTQAGGKEDPGIYCIEF